MSRLFQEAVSIDRAYFPSRAKPFKWQRVRSAFCAAATLLSSPFQADSTGACSARQYEKLTCHGCEPIAFIAFKWSVASSALCPPDKKTIPGTAAGA